MQKVDETTIGRARIAYLTHTYPNYSTTFTRDEVRLLTGYGLDITVCSLRKPPANYMTDELVTEVAQTKYVRPVPILSTIRSHGTSIFRTPLTYLMTLLSTLLANSSSLLQLLKSVLHFSEAVHLGRVFLAENIGLVHVQFADTAGTYAAVIHRLYQIPYSVTIHAHDIFERRFVPRLIGFRVDDADLIRVSSSFAKNWLIERVGISPEKIEVIRSGISPHKFKRISSPGVSPPIILSVGRLVEYKGYTYLLRACRILVDSGYEFSCKIIGSGPEYPVLKSSLQELRLNDHVELLGIIQHGELRKYLEHATIFALPCCQASDGAMDGVPHVLMEAMAMEIPVVSTVISGIPELIENEVDGLLVPPGDSVALAKSIGRLLEDEGLRVRLGRNGLEKIRSDYDVEKILPRFAAMLSAIAREKEPIQTVSL